MKKQNTLFASGILGILLAISILNSAPLVTAQNTPGTVIQTGDTFEFSEDSLRTSNNSRYFTMNNVSNGVLLHGDDEYNYEYVIGTGMADVGFIRQTANIPPLPPGMDTLISINSEFQSEPGSYREGYSNHTIDDQQNPGTWENPEGYYEDLSGWHDGREESMGMSSNSTYAIIFPEMMLNQLDIFADNNGGGGGNNDGLMIGTFDGKIPLFMQTKTTGIDSYTINGGLQDALNTITVVTMFYGFWNESQNVDVALGEPGDPQTPIVNLNQYSSLEINYTMINIYDADSTLLLETSRESSFEVHWDFPYQTVSLTFPNGGPTWSINVEQEGVFDQTESQTSTIDTASSFYGNVRPTSDPSTLRIDDGEHLVYDLEQGNDWDLNIDFKMENKNTPDFFEAGFDMHGYDKSKGDLYIDVYRHQTPNLFDAVIFLDGLADYSFDRYEYENNNGNFVDDDPAPQTASNVPVTFFGLIQLPTDADHDVLPFFEDSMWIDTGFLDDCRDGDDCVNFNFERQLAKDGAVNVTSYYINLVEDSDGEYPVINGFTQYEFNATEHTQLYSLTYSGLTQVPIGDGPGRQWIDVTITATAEGHQSFYYDDDTGAMVAMTQEMHATVEIHHTGDISYFDEQSQSNVDATIHVDVVMNFESRWNMILSSHPDAYTSQPTMPPTVPPTSSTPPVDDSDSESAQLPLPVPYASIIFGIFSVGLLVRRKN